jgi:MFS family permease
MPPRASSPWSIFVAVGLLVAGNGLQGTLVGLRAGIEGMSEQAIGLIMSANFLGFVAGSLWAPALIQSVGHIRTFAALASLASAVALAFAVFVSVPVWVGLRALHGACFAGLVIVVESWLNASSSRETRGQVLAVYMIVLYAAWATSQQFINLAPVDGFVLFVVVSVCLSLALVPIALTRAGAPGVVEATRLGLRRLWRVSPLAIFGAFALGAGVGAFLGLAPVYGQIMGLSDAQVAFVMTTMLLGALALQWPIGWLSDRIDRRAVIVAAAAGASLAAAGVGLVAAGSLAAVVALVFLLGGCAMPIYSVCVAHANDQVNREEVIAVSSGLVMTYGVGSAIGPFVASLAMGILGAAGLMWFVSAMTGALALFGLYRAEVGETTPEADKQDYVAVPQTSHAAMPLHRHGSGAAKGESAPQ